MSKRLKDILEMYLVKNGPEGFGMLGQKMDRDAKTIRRWRDGSVPNAHIAFQLALACGCEEREALSIAKEFPSVAKRRTA